MKVLKTRLNKAGTTSLGEAMSFKQMGEILFCSEFNYLKRNR